MTTPITLFLSVFEHETFWKLAIWVWQYRPERLSFWEAKARSWRMAGLPVLKARRCAPFFLDTIDLNTLKEEPCWKWWNVLEKEMLLWTPREVFGSSRVTPPVCHVCLYSLSSVPCTQRFVWPWHSCHGLRRMQLCKKQKEMGNMDKMAWSVDFIKGRTAWEVEYSDFGRIPRSFFQQAVCSRQFEKYHWNLEPVRVRQGFLPSWFSMCSRNTEVVEELILKRHPNDQKSFWRPRLELASAGRNAGLIGSRCWRWISVIICWWVWYRTVILTKDNESIQCMSCMSTEINQWEFLKVASSTFATQPKDA